MGELRDKKGKGTISRREKKKQAKKGTIRTMAELPPGAPRQYNEKKKTT